MRFGASESWRKGPPGRRSRASRAARWYERALSGLGQEFQAEVERVVELAAQRKLPGVPIETKAGRPLRRALLKRFPYAVYFELRDEGCVVWAVAHGRRRPGYWKGRL